MRAESKGFIRIALALLIVLSWFFLISRVSKYVAEQRVVTVIIYHKGKVRHSKHQMSNLKAFNQTTTLKPGTTNAKKIVLEKPKVQPTVSEKRRIEIINQSALPLAEDEYNSKMVYRYKYYSVSNPEIFHLKDVTKIYTVKMGSLTCFAEGTDISATLNRQSKICICKGDWWGRWCSFPLGFKSSSLPAIHKDKVRLRDKPRRVIVGTPFNMEFEMMEARLDELGDIVDLFMISESCYTAFGDKKPRNLLNRLRQGYLLPLQDKIAYVAITHFPSNGKIDGWIADDLPRHELGLTGLRRQVNNSRSDDLFIMNDTDEIPSREAVLFLKMHDGYPEPFGFHLKWTTYGFYWRGGNGVTPTMAGSSIGMVKEVFQYRTAHVRNPEGYIPYHPNYVSEWKKKSGNEIFLWKLGNEKTFVGWHCSWCFSPQMAQVKLVSAQNGDFPRWGDQEKNLDIKYLKTLRAKGQWFDNSQMAATDATKPSHAPKYFTKNPDKYPYLIKNVYKDELKL